LPELGRRGEGWVAGQLVLLAATVGCAYAGVYWPHGAESFLAVLGLVVGVAGLVLFVAGIASLGRAATPFPRPHRRGRLVQSGVYRAVRHPIYGAVVLLAAGWSLALAPLGLISTALLALFLDLKARREEAWLVERYPGYDEYRQRSPWRFVPGLY
jgi:protein-S-isoprenylcysteine O-methyltransferase Ste14